MTTTSTTGEVAGLSVHHHVPGSGPAPLLVVLVHGTMDRGAGWARVSRHLRHREVVRYDRRGYGRSLEATPPPGRSPGFAGHLADLVAVTEARAEGRPVVVAGHSYGGLLAIALAGSGRGRVAAVVAYEAPLPWEPWWPAIDESHRGDPEGLAETFLRSMIGDATWMSLPPSTRRARRAEGHALIEDLTGIDVRPPECDAVAAPVVLGVGGETAGRHRRAVEEARELWRPRRIVEIPGAGHGAQLTHPEAVADLVELAVGYAET